MTDADYAKIVQPARLEITRVLPALPERVWQYLVNPELRKQWFCGGETGSSPGEDFVMEFDHTRLSDSEPPDAAGCSNDPMTMTGKIVKFNPPSILVYDWPGDHGGDTRVTITLNLDGENTQLHLVHEQLTNPDYQRGASAGWHAHLDLLVDLIGQQPTRDFWLHFGALKAEYDKRIDVACDQLPYGG